MYRYVIGAVIVGAIVAAVVTANSNTQRYKNRMKYTCGVEGGCEMSINGTYDTKQKCEEECGWKNKK